MRSNLVSLASRGAEALYRALWFVAIPLSLAGFSARHLVPAVFEPAGEGAAGALVRMARENPLLVGVALFLGFGAVVRYWSPYLPGAQVLAIGEHPVKTGARNRVREALALAGWMALAALAALGFRAVVFEAYRVTGASMLPTFESGDCILANKSSFGLRVPFSSGSVRQRSPRRGELVVFEHHAAGEPEHLIKRVIGLPGDHLTMRGGHPVINGWPVPSCDAGTYFYAFAWGGVHGRLMVEFLDDQAYLTVHTPLTTPFTGEYVVKPGEVFVLGDNRNASTDSRAWNAGAGGGVPVATIDGAVQRFLLGTRRDGTVDLRRLLSPPGTQLHLEGIDVAPLDAGIARCLKARPHATIPPTADAASRILASASPTP